MADGIDIYDVTAEAEKVVREERYARIRHVESVEKDLRAEFRSEVMELREEVGELVAEAHTHLNAVVQACDAGLKELRRTLDARAESGV